MVVSVRKYKVGYEVRQERVPNPSTGQPHLILKSAYTRAGDYIGSSRDAYILYRKYGIAPEKANPNHNVCSIGFSALTGKWYGWSHRAIGGFGIGDIVKEGDCAASSGWTEEYLKAHPVENTALPVGFVANTLADARRIAVAFAASVS